MPSSNTALLRPCETTADHPDTNQCLPEDAPFVPIAYRTSCLLADTLLLLMMMLEHSPAAAVVSILSGWRRPFLSRSPSLIVIYLPSHFTPPTSCELSLDLIYCSIVPSVHALVALSDYVTDLRPLEQTAVLSSAETI